VVSSEILVLKFGSSVLRSRADLPTVVQEIYRWYRQGARVLAVVSALGDHTQELLAEARDLCNHPEDYAGAELLATGERRSAVLLGVALDRSGIPARVLDPRENHLIGAGSARDSDPIGVNIGQLRKILEAVPVVVVPGSFGYGAGERLELFGRGGSDVSAVLLASALGCARCRLIKDVDGVYDQDPAKVDGQALRFASLDYARVAAVSSEVVRPKAVAFLKRHMRVAEVAGLALPYESIIHSHGTRVVPSLRCPPLRVVLLGLGTVGSCVYERLMSLPDHFTIAGALVRERNKHVARGLPSSLLSTAWQPLFDLAPDVVIELLPGLEPARTLIDAFLEQGASAVSANKQVIAKEGVTFVALAQRKKVELRYSAAVGGSAPLLEALQENATKCPIRSIAGVLNGTCNFVLDRCTAGCSFHEAVREAQERGFAEADPTEDLSGRDAGRKLTLLARAAFGHDPTELRIEPLNSHTLARHDEARRAGRIVRLVATADLVDETIIGVVRLQAIEAQHPLAQTRDEWNALLITRTDNSVQCLRGRGAGPWPTTEAVIADLMDIRRGRILSHAGSACTSAAPTERQHSSGATERALSKTSAE
jgi:homoserine dehydrogenase